MNIAFSPPDISELEINEIVAALKSGWITTGPKTKLFEQKIAQYCGTDKAVCLNSATAAMEMTLHMLGIGLGDEVITSAYTYTASASVIHHTGAKIVLVDTALDSYEMDYNLLADAITEKTKAIIPVDIGGVMCDYDRIFEVVESKKHLFYPKTAIQKEFGRIVVMADAAHSIGASYKGKRSGAVADFTCFSFHAVKNLTTAEGGAVTWKNRAGLDNEQIYHKFMLLSLHGQNKDALSKMRLGAWEYDILYPAYKCNMTDLTAAFGLAQLTRFESLLNKRKHIYEKYYNALKPLGIDYLSHHNKKNTGNYHLFMLRLPGMNEEQRNHFIDCMAEKGVACNVHFKPLPMLTAYKKLGFDIRDFPNAYAQYTNEVTLPSHTNLKDNEVDYVINTIFEVMEHCSSPAATNSPEQLEFKRVWENETESIETIYNIIREVGEEMFLQRGLMHWATPLPMDIIKDEVLQKEFYIVRDKSNGQPVAVFNLTSKPSPYYDLETKALYLHRIAVLPKHWRQGIGTTIYNWVKQRAFQEEYQAIRSMVYSEDEVALAFLKKLGYHSLYKRPTRNFIVDCMESPIMPIT